MDSIVLFLRQAIHFCAHNFTQKKNFKDATKHQGDLNGITILKDSVQLCIINRGLK